MIESDYGRIVMTNSAPGPAAGSRTSTRPPWAAATACTIESPRPVPVRYSGWALAEEAPKDLVAVPRRYARAVIAHGRHQLVVFPRRLHHDLAARGRLHERVIKQVAQRLLPSVRHHADLTHVGGALGAQGEVGVARVAPVVGQDVGKELGVGHGRRLVLKGRLQLQQREQRVERAAEPTHGLLNMLGNSVHPLR